MISPQLRAEALHQLRWQQQEWQRILATHPAGTPCLVAPADRAGLNDGLDLLRKAGEDVPQRFYQRGSLVQLSGVARGTTAGVNLAGLLAAITRAIDWFDP